jgi:hypothetical protein
VQRGTPGYLLRKAVASTMAGITLSAVAAMKWEAGLDDEEIEERLDPRKGKFLKVPVDLGEGRKVEVGFSNMYTSAVKLLGDLSGDEPYTDGMHWLRGKAAFAPSLAWNMMTGKDYMGNPISVADSVAQSFVPIALQDLAFGDGSVFEKVNINPWGLPEDRGPIQTPKKENVYNAIFSILGLSSYPGSDSDLRLYVLDRTSQAKYGKDYYDLSIPQQAVIVKASANEMPPADPDKALRAKEFAQAKQDERVKKMTAGLSPANRKTLRELDKELPAYQSKLAVNGVEVPLGPRADRYEQLLVAEYEKVIGRWKPAAMQRWDATYRSKWMEKQLEEAKKSAKRRLIQESR